MFLFCSVDQDLLMFLFCSVDQDLLWGCYAECCLSVHDAPSPAVSGFLDTNSVFSSRHDAIMCKAFSDTILVHPQAVKECVLSLYSATQSVSVFQAICSCKEIEEISIFDRSSGLVTPSHVAALTTVFHNNAFTLVEFWAPITILSADIIHALSGCSNLKNLHLDSPSASDESTCAVLVSDNQINAMATALPAFHQLTRLCLNGLWMTDDILQRLAHEVEKLLGLRWLHLAQSSLTELCLTTISSLLSRLVAINVVDVSESRFGEAGACREDLRRFKDSTMEHAQFELKYTVMKNGKNKTKSVKLGCG